MDDTIFAEATARGKAGVAIIRVSGPKAWTAARVLAGDLPAPHRAALRSFRAEGELIDRGLLLLFPEGASFTGENVAEFHLHGSLAVTRALLDALGRIEGLRPAAPGEFTRRALLNGRLDLAQVEGLSDLIAAETEAQRKQALRVFSGELGRKVGAWREDLVEIAAHVEALIDFSDEEVPESLPETLIEKLDRIRGSLEAELRGSAAAERIREGFEVAIIGAPNVGKSSLLNHLIGREAAIVSDVPGTTRDVIEVRLEIGGLPVTLLDTAGLHEADDAIEQIGIERARERARAADLRLILTEHDGEIPEGVTPGPDDLIVVTKIDLMETAPAAGIGISSRTGAGIDALLSALEERLSAKAAGASLVMTQRQRHAIQEALRSIAAAQEFVERADEHPEMLAEHLRQAIEALEMLIGKVDVEHLLDDIFSRFCIGK